MKRTPVPTRGDDPTLALDLDSTLAATMEAAFVKLGVAEEYGYEDVTSWDWGPKMFGDEFLDAIHDAWRDNQTIIPTLDNDPAYLVDELCKEYTVHILTHQPEDSPEVTQGKAEWLDYHGIEVDALKPISPSISKARFDYDVFVDDKPSLVEEAADDATVVLRAHPYNDDVGGADARFQYLDDAVAWLMNDARASDEVQGGEIKQLLSGDEAASTLAADTAELLADSRDSHGDAVENQEHIAEAWEWYLDGHGKLVDDAEITGMDVSRMMPLLKMSRAAVGEYDLDHDRDVAGYAAIAGACAYHRGLASEDELTAFGGGNDE